MASPTARNVPHKFSISVTSAITPALTQYTFFLQIFFFFFQMASSFSKDHLFFAAGKQGGALSCLAAFTYIHGCPADSKLILLEGKANV